MDDTNSVRDLLRQAVTKRISELEKIIEHYKNIDFNDKNVVNFYCSVFVCCKEQTSTFEEAFICQNNGEIDYSKLLGSVHHTQRYMDIHRNSYIYPWTKNSEKIQVFDDIEERFLISPQELIKTPIPYDFKNIDPQDFAPHQQIYFFKKTKNSMFQNVSNITFLNQNVDEKKKIVSVTHIETIGKDAEKNIENLKSLTIGKKQIGHRINFDSNQKSVSKKSKKNTKTKVAKKGTDVRDETSEKIDKLLEMFDSNMDAFNFNPVDDDKENLNVKENPDLSTKEVKGKLIEKGSPFPVLKDKENSVSHSTDSSNREKLSIMHSNIHEKCSNSKTTNEGEKCENGNKCSDLTVSTFRNQIQNNSANSYFGNHAEINEQKLNELKQMFEFYCETRLQGFAETDVLNIAIKKLKLKVGLTYLFIDFFLLANKKAKDPHRDEWEAQVLEDLYTLQLNDESDQTLHNRAKAIDEIAKHGKLFTGSEFQKLKLAEAFGKTRKTQIDPESVHFQLLQFTHSHLYLLHEAYCLVEFFFGISTQFEKSEDRNLEAQIIEECISHFCLPSKKV